MPVGFSFVHLRDAQQFIFAEGRGHDLQANRQAGLVESAGDTDAGHAGQIGGYRINIR